MVDLIDLLDERAKAASPGYTKTPSVRRRTSNRETSGVFPRKEQNLNQRVREKIIERAAQC